MSELLDLFVKIMNVGFLLPSSWGVKKDENTLLSTEDLINIHGEEL
jgi:hypothetical protein